jgi:tRNA pseudouridine55 synthase
MRVTSTDALLLVDKPAGMSSHDVIAIARRALGTPKIGHGGTLDPFATGLLVIMVGRGTRLLQFVPSEPKVYEASIRFGRATDTDDSTGNVIVDNAPQPQATRVRDALPALTGALLQLPPDFSAKHVGGARAYAMARRGVRPELSPVAVRVDGWDVLEQGSDLLRARITCGTGTYIRALARDLGRSVGSAAHLEALRRLRVGPFSVDQANSVEELKSGQPRLLPLTAALAPMPLEALDEADVRRVRQGMSVTASVDGLRAALTDREGELVAVAARRGDTWHPDVVLASA